MFEVPSRKWSELTLANAMSEADAYLIGGTDIRSNDVIEALERKLNKPVITSNQAMVWHCLRALGIRDRIPGFGRLLTEY